MYRLFSWKYPVTDDETAFAAIQAGLDLAGPGEKVFLNTGAYAESVWLLSLELRLKRLNHAAEFYGGDPPIANLLLLSRFFEKYPDYKERAFISLKV